MKKFYILCLMAMASSLAMANELVATATKLEKNKVVEEASDTAKWTFPGSVGLNVNQAYFSPYSVEGSGNSVSMDAFVNLNANYKKKKTLWENSLSAKYGMLYSTEFTGKDKVRKNVDEIILNSKYGYKVSKYWYASVLGNLETQFAEGNDYSLKDDEGNDIPTMISHFWAPATLKFSLGMEYIPNKYFSAFISPITARLTFCRLDELGESFGMELLKNPEYDADEKLIREAEYKHLRAELGAYFKLKSDFDITKNLHFLSTLEGFYAYNKAVSVYSSQYTDTFKVKNPDGKLELVEETDEDFMKEPGNKKFSDEKDHGWYLKWKLELLLKVSKYMNVSFKTQLKYDNAERKAVEGENYGLPEAKVQFWETTSLGIAYTF